MSTRFNLILYIEEVTYDENGEASDWQDIDWSGLIAHEVDRTTLLQALKPIAGLDHSSYVEAIDLTHEYQTEETP